MNAYQRPSPAISDSTIDWEESTLPVVDNGYYDTLVAIGFGALADAYYDTPKTPLVEWTLEGFRIFYVKKRRPNPDLQWLKYSLASSWKKDLEDGNTKIANGWDDIHEIEHGGAVVDTSERPMVQIEIRGEKREIVDPDRRLYGVINKLGKPDWVNLCIYACRTRGIELLEGSFEEKAITLNSIVFPQSSKGANSKSSCSIRNASMPKSFSRPLSRLTCLAVAGLTYAAIGQSPTGFAIPSPQKMRIDVLGQIASKNRQRYVNGGFFFSFDNYLNFVKLLLLHTEDFEAKLGETQKLRGATGVSFVELGTSASPSGTWQLIVPLHQYSLTSVEKLQSLLINWKRKKRPSSGGEPSIDRKAVRALMNGFEASNIASAVEGYLQYIDAVGIQENYNLLNQTFFEEIMAHTTKYRELLEEFKSEEVQRFITLIRDETYKKVFTPKGKKSEQPNYQMMRKLREIQNSKDFITALTEIAVERGTNKLASEMTEKNEMKHMVMPYEKSLTKLIELSEDPLYSPRIIAQLLLAFALSKTTTVSN